MRTWPCGRPRCQLLRREGDRRLRRVPRRVRELAPRVPLLAQGTRAVGRAPVTGGKGAGCLVRSSGSSSGPAVSAARRTSTATCWERCPWPGGRRRHACSRRYARRIPGGVQEEDRRGRRLARRDAPGCRQGRAQRRGRDAGLHRLPARALAPRPSQPRSRADKPRDPEADKGGPHLPRRQLRPHGRQREAGTHSRERMGREEMPGYDEVGGDERAGEGRRANR